MLSILLGAVSLWRYVGFLSPSRLGTKILRALSPSLESVIVPKPYLLESQMPLTQTIALFDRCLEL